MTRATVLISCQGNVIATGNYSSEDTILTAEKTNKQTKIFNVTRQKRWIFMLQYELKSFFD